MSHFLMKKLEVVDGS